jgi:hypothetical protein
MAANVTASRRTDRDAHAVLKAIPLEPLASPPVSKSTSVAERSRRAMASNADAVYADDADLDQALRSRNNASRSQPKAPVSAPAPSSKSAASSEGIDSDNEDVPLLSPTAHDYGSGNRGRHGRRDSDSDSDGALEWDGQADFRGLPWWKRPSVGAARCRCIMSIGIGADMDRSTGCSRRSSSSP